MSPTVREHVLRTLQHVAESVAGAHGCQADVEITHGEPVLQNDDKIALRTRQVLSSLGLAIDSTLRSAGSDDFAYYCEKYPSLMLFVGTDDQEERLHSTSFVPDNGHIRDVAYAMLSGYMAAAELAQPRILTTDRHEVRAL